MNMRQEFQKNYQKWFGKDVLRAIKRYGLIEQGEKVCVALSGGKDSMTLLFILQYLKQFSYLDFDLSAVHIKIGEYETGVLRAICESFEIEYLEDRLLLEQRAPEKIRCYLCSRLKRGAISNVLRQHEIQKVAYGHHADDVAETFLMNLIQNRKLGSFSPKVEYANNPMILIRPMIYLGEATVQRIHQHIGLPVLDAPCPYANDNIRRQYKQSIQQLNTIFRIKAFSKNVVAALENLDETNIWSRLVKELS
ncbi:PP-loop domain protein [Candidatus Vecturithrix granuli]|uniref:PP-loop domain protein n=1 Tax=Vecturithrix granuli TaxID=1499967 RepID=A0A081C9Z7_VECG1|nr:PP-loop domain protein [Candidatus Vecturithrix granuli]